MSAAETVRAFLSAMEKMDFDRALQLVANEVEYINGNSPAVTGPDAIRQTLEPFFAPLEENQFVVLREASSGNVVFLERLDRHRAEHGWFELPVTGVFECRDGRIVYWRDYFDLAVLQPHLARLLEAS